MKRKVRVGAVSYLNTKPLIYGLEQGLMQDQVDLVLDYPSKIAQHLIDDTIDIGLVPIAIIPELKEYHIDSDFCIGSKGKVASVCLFSDVPLSEIEEILLDYQSRTSIALTRVIADKHWKINPRFTAAGENFISEISGSRAGVIIGDRALQNLDRFKYVYDLGEAWLQFSGLPFVFATWVSNKKFDDDFVRNFNDANTLGFNHLEEIISGITFPEYDLRRYFTENLSYELDAEKKKALALFLDILSETKDI